MLFKADGILDQERLQISNLVVRNVLAWLVSSDLPIVQILAYKLHGFKYS